MQIEITDVFLRDGLQDEPVIVPTAGKVQIARAATAAGIGRMEIASFVNPKRVPQMADADDVVTALSGEPGVRFTVLALNGRGIARAVAAGASEVQVVASASQAHSNANAGAGIEQALDSLAADVAAHPQPGFFAGISTAFTCPFEGEIDPSRLLRLVRAFKSMGITDIGLADTLGTTPPRRLISSVKRIQDAEPDLAYSLHLHNAHGQALDTVKLAIDAGITRFDAALGGYGGCPFAPGAAGNLSTGELVDFLHAEGHTTGIDPAALAEANDLARATISSAPPVQPDSLSIH
ncbi:hydroxymethylglutaryl-CoA lyase [Glutamicibacter mysorens]|uniref:hydroxymethylglutaryl-CoA lyase n=1 Tax=Glutamicibacter mysorens TaxID=257984 RepID=UPI0020C705BB|nr:hydroxymethylglutaryl-CoA lyase [Glutamicibacter mysorens]UTM47634.1 hydroxymethylglutaryl-CoA lyase [Glutamicibacter mysorens]